MDIVRTLIEGISDAVGVPAFSDAPKDRPDEFVTVECVGGSRDRFVDRPSAAVQSWSTSKAGAHALAERVDSAIEGMAGGPSGITHVERGMPYSFPSSDGLPRYQSVYDFAAHRN